MHKRQWLKNVKDWAISNQVPNRERLNDYPKGVETSVSKCRASKDEDIVCTISKGMELE
jgi:hypothetical protein